MKWYRKKHLYGLEGEEFKDPQPAHNFKEAWERTKERTRSIFSRKKAEPTKESLSVEAGLS